MGKTCDPAKDPAPESLRTTAYRRIMRHPHSKTPMKTSSPSPTDGPDRRPADAADRTDAAAGAPTPDALLRSHGIRPTANRISIVRALSAADRPLSLLELEIGLVTIDRSGIFRTLTALRDARLVHVLEDGADGVRYELCRSHGDGRDDDLHVHFHCERCRRTFCLPGIPLPSIDLPDGYVMTGLNYMVKGICPQCGRKQPKHV